MLLFTMRLVNFIKYPDYFHVVVVIMYFQLIRNEISFICFTIALLIKPVSSGASLLKLSNLVFNVVKPKRLKFFAQNTLCVLLSV